MPDAEPLVSVWLVVTQLQVDYQGQRSHKVIRFLLLLENEFKLKGIESVHASEPMEKVTLAPFTALVPSVPACCCLIQTLVIVFFCSSSSGDVRCSFVVDTSGSCACSNG